MTYAVIFFFALALFLWSGNLGFCRLARDWPLLAVVIGLLMLARVIGKNSRQRIIDRLTRGEISADEAIRLLKKGKP